MKKRSTQRPIYITDFEMQRLEDLIDAYAASCSRDSNNLEQLQEELLKAEVVDPAGIPPDIVTMNSRVCLEDMGTGNLMEYTLVFPKDSDPAAGKISILAPVGTAMIGYRTGDSVSWAVPGGVRNLKINKVLYQPEAAGNYHL